METPLAYIPMDRRQALVRGETLPETSTGAALFADISGFTPLTEMLTRALGARRGAEELTIYLNRVYDALIGQLHQYGGSVLAFSGDAITCWFGDDDGRRATATALAMQAAMRDFANLEVVQGEHVALAVKTAVAVGPVRRFIVGDPVYALLDVMAGVTLERLATAEHHAQKGDVVVDATAAHNLADLANITTWHSDAESGEQFAVVGGLTEPIAPAPWPPIPPDAIPDETMRAWLLPTIYRRLLAGQGEFLAELRPAAVLFLNFSGLDYDDDPEAPTKLHAFISEVQEVVARSDGNLLGLTIGDKGSYLYAAFGAPIAHEDDIDRAATAALALRGLPERFGYINPVQIGVTYGRMRVGAYGGTMRRTYGVLGDIVNLAARLMQAAVPGQILVNDEARSHASDSFVWESLEPIRVKGKSEPIAVSELKHALKRRTGVTLTDRFPLPPIGRAEALTQLEAALGKLANGQGQVVRLMGEAGTGKSHLAAYFTLTAQGQGAQVWLGTAQSMGQTNPYLPWRQIFYALLDLGEQTTAATLLDLTEMLAEEYPTWEVRLPLLGDLLNLPIPDNATTAAMDSDMRQKALFSLLIEMVQDWASRRPMAIILENGHWMDEASLSLAQTLAQQATTTSPFLLLLVHRQEHMGEKVLLGPLNSLANYTEVALGPLRDIEVTALMQRQLGGRPEPLVRDIVQRTARGNPFYISELLAAMRQGGQVQTAEDGLWHIEAGLLDGLRRANMVAQEGGQWRLIPEADLTAVKLGLPDSIHGLVLSRLDRLPEEHKVTLKVSSVIGHIIDLALVAKAHPTSKVLGEVEAEADYMANEELIREETPERLLYAFRHHTTQEVAYETLLHTQRQQLHQAVAEALATLQPEATGAIAHHAYVGQVWPLALRYNQLAGERAKQLHANQQALDFLQKALHSSAALPEAETAVARMHIQLALGELLIGAGQHEPALGHLSAALTLAQAEGDFEAEARCCRWQGRAHELRGEYEAALEWLARGFGALNGRASGEEAELSLIAGLINTRRGNYNEAWTLCERSLAVGQMLDDAAILARTYNLMGIVEMRRQSESANGRFEQSLAQYEQMGNLYGQATSHNLMANSFFGVSNWMKADYHYRRALDLFTQTGNLYNQVLVQNNLGGLALKQGRLEAALGYYQRAVRLLEQIGGSVWVFGALSMNLGNTHLQRGELEVAAGLLQRARQYMDQAQVRDLYPELYSLLAEAAWRQGDLAQAEALAEESVALAREMTQAGEEGHNLRILGEIVRARGDVARARELFEQCLGVLAGVGDVHEGARGQLSLAHLLAAVGEHSAAQAALSVCLPVFRQLAAELDLATAEALAATLGG